MYCITCMHYFPDNKNFKRYCLMISQRSSMTVSQRTDLSSNGEEAVTGKRVYHKFVGLLLQMQCKLTGRCLRSHGLPQLQISQMLKCLSQAL